MARHGDYLYRRNGRFYARLRIPSDLQAVYGRSDLRTSLETADYSAARLRVLETVLGWKRAFQRVRDMLNAQQLVAGSPLLLGEGLISLDSAARETGIAVDELLREARNRGLELRIEATGWVGAELPSHALDFDHDGALDLSCADAFPEAAIFGQLFLRRESLTLVEAGTFHDCLFYRNRSRKSAVVCRLPGVSVPVASLLIAKADAEAVRSALAATVTPAMLEASARKIPPAPESSGHKYGRMRASELLEEYFRAKGPNWSEATRIQMTGMCGAFVELMGDPTLAAIDKVLLLRYREELTKLPQNLHLAARRWKTRELKKLIEAASAEGAPRMSEDRSKLYVAKIGEAFGWGVRNGFMPENPASGVLERKRKTQREQDERDAMSPENLQKIFSVSWFQMGRGERTAEGKHWSFQPHYYWLPLMALYVGGRLTELSQLYLDDLSTTPSGVWFVDFRVDRADKKEEVDKRLKTVNSTRQVPLHHALIELGLPEYVQALRDSGEQRLFPELRFDRVKGYGKQSGQWFNERFLGRNLGVPRDGKQTFHSLRHNFVTALMQLNDPPLSEFTVNQLSGHERGETMSARRYAKDAAPDTLKAAVDRMIFELPRITPFDIEDGLAALKAAQSRKAPGD